VEEKPKKSAEPKGAPGVAKAKPAKAAPKAKKPASEAKQGSRELDAKTIRIGLAALIAVVLVVALAFDIFGGDDSSSEEASKPGGNAVGLSESALIARAGSLEHPVYWVGGRVGTESYELDKASTGNVYIRYLTGDAQAGDPGAEFLTVGTYPVPEASKALHEGAKTATEGQKLSRHDGFEALSSPQSTNAYVVFDDEPELQIEIYSPQPGEAAELATSGALEPLG
jgi:hypothetical protein